MQKFHKRSRQSSVHLYLVVSVYPQILKSSKYGHFVIMATLFWPSGKMAIHLIRPIFFGQLVTVLMGFH